MPVEEMVDRYRQLLTDRAEVLKRQLDFDIEIQVLEKQMELRAKFASVPSVPRLSTKDQFLAEFADKLEPHDYEFLESDYRGGKEVHRHTEISESSLKRLADAGKIEVQRTDSGHRRYKTTSVLRYLLSDPTQET